jgi:endo-1,4-beta-xylanase
MSAGIAVAAVVAAVAVAAGCTGGGATHPTPTTSNGSLPDLARARGLAIGAGINDVRLPNVVYRGVITGNFTSISPQNSFKWSRTEPQRGQFDFVRTNGMVEFARQNHLRVRACCLLWYGRSNPGWVVNGHWTRSQLLAIVHNHISTLVGRYRGRVAEWDVVNEPVDQRTNRLRANIWEQTIGPAYLAYAFRWAHEADPDAKLFLNDFGNDSPGAHFDKFYDIVRTLKSQGVPIHGVGLEMHRGFGHPTPDEVYDAMQKYEALGLRVEITEMDLPVALPASQSTLDRQGGVFREMTSVCLRVRACTGVTFWGVDDRDRYLSLINANRGAMTMFSRDDLPKPAYFGVVAALKDPAAVTDRLDPGKPAG